MLLRVYIAAILSILVSLAFIFLGIENYERSQQIKDLEKTIEQKHKIEKERELPILPPPPLPVCARGEKHSGCRPLAADESGATIRGVRDETSND